MESSIVETTSTLPHSSLYPLTVDLLLWLYKAAQSPEDQNSAQAGVVQGSVWETLRALILAQIEAGQASPMERITRFLLAFHGPLAVGKKRAQVSFSPEEGASKPRHQSKPASSPVSALVEDVDSPLIDLVSASCSQAQEQCEDLAKPPLKFLAQVLKVYKTSHLLNLLLKEENLNIQNITQAYFERVLMSWLLQCPVDRAVAGSLVDILDTVYSMTESEEIKLQILAGFYKVSCGWWS